ncbi:MAG: hypothetical protein N2749_02165 [Clostridia bacterium]|nr:hypothetical protein [Clostridia bacterium]
MFFGAFRKTIGLFLIAFGIGIVMTIILPIWAWITVIAACVVILRNILAFMLRRNII